MRTRQNHHGLIVTVAGATLLALGIAFAIASAPPKRSKPKQPSPSGDLDCRLLEQQLATCGVEIAIAFDPTIKARLAKQTEPLQGVLRRSISQEFLARVGSPCFQRKGRLDQGPELKACVEAAANHAKGLPCPKPKTGAAPKTCNAWRAAQQCKPLAACLLKKIRALPKPKKK